MTEDHRMLKKRLLSSLQDIQYDVDRKINSPMTQSKLSQALIKTVDQWTSVIKPQLEMFGFESKRIVELDSLFNELGRYRTVGRSLETLKQILTQISECLIDEFIHPLRKQ